MARIPFFAVRHQPPPLRRIVLMVLSFVLPLGLWAAVSYLPFLWHPLMEIRLGGQPTYTPGDRIPKASWRDLVVADEAWFTDWQAAGASAGDRYIAVPGQDPIAGGRQLRRSNSKAFYSFSPALIAAGQLNPDDERDVDAIHAALNKWRSEAFADAAWPLSDSNRLRIDALIDTVEVADGSVTMPGDKVLPGAAPQGFPANPVFLPAPHEVVSALVGAFVTPPLRDEDPWLHERLVHSLWVVVKGFGLALIIGLPLGIVAGSFPALSRLIEPVTGFIGYIPPPAFAALLVAVLGLKDGPKVGIVFIASVFPMIIMVANTVRSVQVALIEAAQTLGASRSSLVTRVIIPSALPNIFNDIRVLLALGWTILIIAEITGEKSGLSAYMEQQGRYRHYENVFAAMLVIGSLGLVVDQLLAAIQPLLFPWQGKPASPIMKKVWWLVTLLPRMAAADGESKQAAYNRLETPAEGP